MAKMDNMYYFQKNRHTERKMYLNLIKTYMIQIHLFLSRESNTKSIWIKLPTTLWLKGNFLCGNPLFYLL